MSSKYSREFKLKVLEYYFEHGGDKKFGNKARTANHFCIDHKTVSRMLCNPEMVKKARKMLGKKSGCSTENASKSSKPNIKIGQPFVSVEKIVGSATQRIGSPSSSSTKSPKKFHTPQRLSETPVIELPEDPDFSVLKSSIDTSVSSVPHVARLLVTGNHEVKYIIANECDLIFECKVCRNLFRSVINFLAHKRIYCLDRYSSVRNLFNKDMASNMTTESETVFVEPEPPPPSSPAQKDSPPPVVQVAQENVEVSESAAPLNKIDQIAALLAKKGKEKGGEEPLSSATHKGSSEYFNRIENINNARKSMGTDCTVVLQDIKDVSCAVYQSVFPRNNNPVTPRKTSHQRKRVRPVQLDSEGKVVEKKEKEHGKKIQPPIPKKVPVINKKKEEIETDVPCKSCNSVFPSKKMLNTHVEEVHGLERMVYTCPICNVIFLSIWGCIKHLIRIHKKKRHHRERLKHVICSRAYKKVFTAKEIAKHSHKSCAEIPKAGESKTDGSSSKETPHSQVSSQGLMEEEREMDKLGSSDKAKESSNSRVFISGTEEESPGHSRNKVPVLLNTCPRCLQSFPSPTVMGSHLQLCSIKSLSNTSETPEKKIAIQIRKDYKKESASVTSPTLKDNISGSHSLVTVKQKLEENHIKKDENFVKKKIEERLNELCLIKSLTCIPCNRKYNTIHILKRHMSTHMGWSRFSCSECNFRHYEKYVCVEHCISVHKYGNDVAEELVIKEERLDECEDMETGKVGSFTLETGKGDSFTLEIGKGCSFTNDMNKKLDGFQNGDCTNSECSASIVSEDSVSLKSEFDGQENESADVAYRELIDKKEDVAVENNVVVEIRAEPPDSNTNLINNNHNSDDKKLEIDLKNERPHNSGDKKLEIDLKNERPHNSGDKKLEIDLKNERPHNSGDKKLEIDLKNERPHNSGDKKLEIDLKTEKPHNSDDKKLEIDLKNEKPHNSDDKKLEIDLKNERPQRNRKVVEQKDFVYEPLRSPIVSSRQDESKTEATTMVIPRQRITSGQTVILKIDRSSTKRKEIGSPVSELASKKTCARVLADIKPHFTICNGQGGNNTIIGRTSHVASVDKSASPTSKELPMKKESRSNPPPINQVPSKKEPVASPLSINQPPSKLNSSPDKDVPKNKDQSHIEMKFKFTGVKLKEAQDRSHTKDDNSGDVNVKLKDKIEVSQGKILGNTSRESVAGNVKNVSLIKMNEEKAGVIVKDSVGSEVKDKDASAANSSTIKTPTISTLINKLQMRVLHSKSEPLLKTDSSQEPKGDNSKEKKDDDLKKSWKKIMVVTPLNKTKPITVQVPSQSRDIKPTPMITRIAPRILVSSPSNTTPPTSSSTSPQTTPSLVRREPKIKPIIQSKDVQQSRELTMKTERSPRRKSIDFKN